MELKRVNLNTVFDNAIDKKKIGKVFLKGHLMALCMVLVGSFAGTDTILYQERKVGSR